MRREAVCETDEGMDDGQRYESEWDGLRIVIEEHPSRFQIFIYDPSKCEVLYTAERMSLDAAKFAAVDFVATTRFGPGHGLEPEIVVAMLV